MKDFPAKAWLLTLGVVAGAIGLGVTELHHHPGLSLGVVLGFGLLVVIAETVPVELAHASYSVGFVVVLAAVIAAGPATALLASLFGALDLQLRRRADWLGRFFFNGAQLALATGIAGIVYRLSGGPIGRILPGSFPRVLVSASLATSAYFVVNVALVGAMVWLVRRVAITELWHANYRGASLSHFSFAILGVLLAVLYLNIGWGAIFFLLLPLLVARGAFHASARLQEAFDATVRSLVTAIEAKDLYTRGHAERVSRLTAMIAREYGFPEIKIRKVRYAALMHDVGKLTVDTRVLQKPGKLTAEEFEHMKVHPIRGAEIVAEIDLLREMVDGVRHHHERMDGRGYPDGLDDQRLSLEARMIMVADAFDAMTSTRSYRKAMPLDSALNELRRCADTQFSAEMIAALERSIGRHGWDAAPEAYEGEKTPRPETSVHAALG